MRDGFSTVSLPRCRVQRDRATVDQRNCIFSSLSQTALHKFRGVCDRHRPPYNTNARVCVMTARHTCVLILFCFWLGYDWRNEVWIYFIVSGNEFFCLDLWCVSMISMAKIVVRPWTPQLYTFLLGCESGYDSIRPRLWLALLQLFI